MDNFPKSYISYRKASKKGYLFFKKKKHNFKETSVG